MNRLIKILTLVGAASLIALGWLLYSLPGIPILAYHKISQEHEIYSVKPVDFERQMKYLADNGYTAISLAEMAEVFAGKRALPAKTIVITFDDGYEDNYLTALPILQKYGFKATVFVIAGQIGRPGYLTWEQIRLMQKSGAEIGSHTVNHAALSEVSPEQQWQEIALSKQMLEANLATPVQFLAYPFGKHDQSVYKLLRQAGYTGACTGLVGLNRSTDDMYRLKRINISRPKMGLWEFRLRLLRANIYSLCNI